MGEITPISYLDEPCGGVYLELIAHMKGQYGSSSSFAGSPIGFSRCAHLNG